ncbi:unnamed protein product [Cylicocyclus nassatus]|uniref:non-specific serine/threonine protein kinase n=1 Tax=Cylicocyclus nassatus TaxID=53992 RepID=A0AA36GPQ5_CYLNA|nr:unnamed protein product [Cylicocyclus nassatus]
MVPGGSSKAIGGLVYRMKKTGTDVADSLLSGGCSCPYVAACASGNRCQTVGFGPWVILKKIDEGGFGQVYKVENVATKKVAALKAESNDIEGGSALKLEMTVIRAITADGDKPHIPLVFHAAKHRRFCYMIMTLLGENLKELKLNCPKEYMTAKTWTRIAIQCLYSVKLVHDYGFVHRDIKPNNFVMGYREDYERARLVHILDFGLSRSYAIQSKDGTWVARRARGTAEFRGTLRYCSPNVHEKKEQGRKDDLWSLYYVFIELHCGLPWQTLRDKQKVELMKMHMEDKDLVLNFPVELHGVIPHLRTLDYYQRPDYSMFYEGLVAVMKRVGAKASDPYDWETPESVRRIEKHLKKPYAWENAAEFFKSDPIKVNCAPPPKPSRRRITKAPERFPYKETSEQTTGTGTTASTDVERRDVPSELTMTDVDKRLAAFGVVRKSPTAAMEKLLEQITKRKAIEALKAMTPVMKSKEVVKIRTPLPQSKEEVQKGSNTLTPLSKSVEDLLAEEVLKRKEKKKKVDTIEDMEKRLAEAKKSKSPMPKEKEVKPKAKTTSKSAEEDAKLKKDLKKAGSKDKTGTKEKLKEEKKKMESKETVRSGETKAKLKSKEKEIMEELKEREERPQEAEHLSVMDKVSKKEEAKEALEQALGTPPLDKVMREIGEAEPISPPKKGEEEKETTSDEMRTPSPKLRRSVNNKSHIDSLEMGAEEKKELVAKEEEKFKQAEAAIKKEVPVLKEKERSKEIKAGEKKVVKEQDEGKKMEKLGEKEARKKEKGANFKAARKDTPSKENASKEQATKVKNLSKIAREQEMKNDVASKEKLNKPERPSAEKNLKDSKEQADKKSKEMVKPKAQKGSKDSKEPENRKSKEVVKPRAEKGSKGPKEPPDKKSKEAEKAKPEKGSKELKEPVDRKSKEAEKPRVGKSKEPADKKSKEGSKDSKEQADRKSKEKVLDKANKKQSVEREIKSKPPKSKPP